MSQSAWKRIHEYLFLSASPRDNIPSFEEFTTIFYADKFSGLFHAYVFSVLSNDGSSPSIPMYTFSSYVVY